jgi:hypothetical protein
VGARLSDVVQGWRRQAGMCATMTFGLLVAWPTPITTFLGMSTPKEGTSTQAAIPYFTNLAWSIYRIKIALLTSGSSSDMAKSKALQTNLDVDYVISYRFAKTGASMPLRGLQLIY